MVFKVPVAIMPVFFINPAPQNKKGTHNYLVSDCYYYGTPGRIRFLLNYSVTSLNSACCLAYGFEEQDSLNSKRQFNISPGKLHCSSLSNFRIWLANLQIFQMFDAGTLHIKSVRLKLIKLAYVCYNYAPQTLWYVMNLWMGSECKISHWTYKRVLVDRKIEK